MRRLAEIVVAMLMRKHYALMASPRFWYDDEMKAKSKRYCVWASNLRRRFAL